MGAEPDFPADLFAVGLVALYLLQGQKPDSKALVEYFTAHGTPERHRGSPSRCGRSSPDCSSRIRTPGSVRRREPARPSRQLPKCCPRRRRTTSPSRSSTNSGRCHTRSAPKGPSRPRARAGTLLRPRRTETSTPVKSQASRAESPGCDGRADRRPDSRPDGWPAGWRDGWNAGWSDRRTAAVRPADLHVGDRQLPPPPPPHTDRQQPPRQQPQPYQPLPGHTRCSRPRPPLPTPRPRIRSRPLPPPHPICRRRPPPRCRTTCRTPVDTPLSSPGFPPSTHRLRTPPPLPPPARSATRCPSPPRTNDGRDRHPR